MSSKSFVCDDLSSESPVSPNLQVNDNGDEMDNVLREALGVFENGNRDGDANYSEESADRETYYRLAAEECP